MDTFLKSDPPATLRGRGGADAAFAKVAVYELCASNHGRINVSPNNLGRWSTILSSGGRVLTVTMPLLRTRGCSWCARPTSKLKTGRDFDRVFDHTLPTLSSEIAPPRYERNLAHEYPYFPQKTLKMPLFIIISNLTTKTAVSALHAHLRPHKTPPHFGFRVTDSESTADLVFYLLSTSSRRTSHNVVVFATGAATTENFFSRFSKSELMYFDFGSCHTLLPSESF